MAERIGREAGRRGFLPRVAALDEYELARLPEEPLVVFVVATTGDGECPDNMKTFWRFLLRKSLPTNALEDVEVAVLGLGDSSYAKFNAAARRLQARLRQLGAREICERGLADEQSEQSTEGDVNAWLTRVLWPALLRKHPLPPGTAIVDRPQLLRPRHLVHRRQEGGRRGEDGLAGYDQGFLRHFRPAGCYAAGAGNAKDGSEFVVAASLVENRRLTADGWSQDVRHFSFDLGDVGVPYVAGDIAVVFCRNSTLTFPEGGALPEDRDVSNDWVVRLARRLGVDPFTRIQLEPNPAAGSAPPLAPWEPIAAARVTHSPDFDAYASTLPGEVDPMGPQVPWPADTTVGELFSRYLNIQGIPPRSAFEQLAFFASDAEQREKLLELAGPEGSDLYFSFCVQEKRSWVEVLEDFGSVQLSLPYLVALVPPLQPRSFSIASSSVSHPGRVELCVAVVDYRTRWGRHKRGVCSSWLASLPGDGSVQVPMYIKRGTLPLPPHPHPPLLLVGPGTGVAPFRALLWERRARMLGVEGETGRLSEAAEDATEQSPAGIRRASELSVHPAFASDDSRVVLFFGNRHREQDFLYGEEWAAMVAEGSLDELHTAFSRDQADKVYVQARLAENRAMVARAIADEGGVVYIAGSAKRMPKDVKEVLGMVLRAEKGWSADQATKYVARMEKERRLVVEAWS